MEIEWDGKTERRKNFCDGHGEMRETIIILKNNMEHLTEAVKRIDVHLEQASKMRVNWWLALTGVICGILIQTWVFSYHLGSMGKQIEINTKRIEVIEREMHK